MTSQVSGSKAAIQARIARDLGTADQLFVDQLEATWLANEQLVAQARANPIENFRLIFSDVFHQEHR